MNPLQGAAFGKGFWPNSTQPGAVTLLSKWQPRKTLSAILATELGILTIRSCRQHCQACAPTTRMPASTLTRRKRATAVKAQAGTIPSGFVGTWTPRTEVGGLGMGILQKPLSSE